MDFRPLNDTERRQLIAALRGNAESDRAILMDRRDTSFAGTAEDVTDQGGRPGHPVGAVPLLRGRPGNKLREATVLALAWTRAANPERYVGLSWVNLLPGIWLIISPFALGYAAYPTPTWNDLVPGVITALARSSPGCAGSRYRPPPRVPPVPS